MPTLNALVYPWRSRCARPGSEGHGLFAVALDFIPRITLW